MTSKEALEIFYKDVKNYNNDMRKYPAYYFDKPKNEEMLRKWEIKQNEMYATILGDLEVLKIVKEHKLLNYVIKNKKCANMYKLTDDKIEKLKEWTKNDF